MRGGNGVLLGLGFVLAVTALLVLLWQPEPPAAVTSPGPVVDLTSAEPEPAPAEPIGLSAEMLAANAEVAEPKTANPALEPLLATDAGDETDNDGLRVRLAWVPNSEGTLPPGGGRPLPTAAVDVDLQSFHVLGLRLDLRSAARPTDVPVEVVWPFEARPSLTVIAGPDEGRSALLGDVDGSLENLSLRGLHAAVQVFELKVGDVVLARRELALAPGVPATIVGPRMEGRAVTTVHLSDLRGEELRTPDLRERFLTLDGREGYQFAPSAFAFEGEFPPDALLEANVPKYAAFRGVLPESEDGKRELRLERADRLTLRTAEPDPPPRLSEFWLLPADPVAASTSPYQRRSQVLSPKGTVFDALSRRDFVAFVRYGAPEPHHAIALAEGGGVAELKFDLLPSAQLTGRVHRRGVAVAGAKVHYHARNPLAATSALLDWLPDAHQLVPLPLLPPSFDTATTDGKGEFLLTDWPRQDSDHWIEVVHPLLRVPHVLALPKSGRHFEFDLAGPPPQAPVGALVLSFPEVLEDTVVHVLRDGVAPAVLPLKGGELHIGPIALGKWRLSVEQAGRSLLADQALELRGLLRVAVEGAVTGADEPPR